MTILLSINTSPLSLLSWCGTSQKSRMSGSVRVRLGENPWLIVFIRVV